MKVWPKNDEIRKALKHQPSGKSFGDSASDGVEWPDDNFTYRRIRDGDVLTQAPSAAPRAAAQQPAEKK